MDQHDWISIHQNSYNRRYWRTSDRVYCWIQRLTVLTESTKYCNARPVWIWCINAHNLYLILYSTGSQCSCWSAGVTWSRKPRLSTRWASAFGTRWSGSMVDWWCTVDLPIVSYSNPVVTEQTRISTEVWLLCRQWIWSVVASTVGTNSCLKSVYRAASFKVRSQGILQSRGLLPPGWGYWSRVVAWDHSWTPCLPRAKPD